MQFLTQHCKYLNSTYLDFLKDFRLHPREEVAVTFIPVGDDTGAPTDLGDIDIAIKGRWVDTILYEIPILALTSEAYFKFMDKDWSYDGQQEKAHGKGIALLEAGCVFSEFGTRRRRDYHTQALVFRGLVQASEHAKERGLSGKLSGTSNVHLAMRFGIPPVGTVAHEWFMGIAAIKNDYPRATEEALRHWIGCFGEGVLGIALTDTFGTPEFLKAFSKTVERHPDAPPASAGASEEPKTYAQVFAGVRQDSGDPTEFVKTMRKFYDSVAVKDKKTIVFSDSLDIERCLEYKKVAEEAGFTPTFGVGTFLTNDFTRLSDGSKSTPMNIVIKLSSADNNQAVKIRYVNMLMPSLERAWLAKELTFGLSDNIGKNTGDKETVEKVKRELGYIEKDWQEGDESKRWGVDGNSAKDQ